MQYSIPVSESSKLLFRLNSISQRNFNTMHTKFLSYDAYEAYVHRFSTYHFTWITTDYWQTKLHETK